MSDDDRRRRMARVSMPSLANEFASVGLPKFKACLQQIEPPARVHVNELWSFIRSAMIGIEEKLLAANEEVFDLKTSMNAARPKQDRISVTRPPTRESIEAMRAQMDDAMYRRASTSDATSDTIEAIFDIPAQYALEALHDVAYTVTKLGCWESPSGEEGSYVKKNWRNSNHPLGRRNANADKGIKIGCQPSLHQVAVIAAGQGMNLRVASTHGTHHVSHLCHNTKCFSPDHVVVESAALNQRRKVCNGRFVSRVFGERDPVTREREVVHMLHPCPHGHEEHMRFCILPLERMWVGVYFEVNIHGEADVRRDIEDEDSQV